MSVVRLNLVRRPHFCRLAMSWMGRTANFLHHGSSWTYVLPSISKLSESTTGTEHMYDPKAQRKYLYLYIRWWRYLRYTHLTSKSCLLHTLCQVLGSPIQIWPKWLMYIVRSTRFCRLPELIEWCCRTHCTQQCQFFLLLDSGSELTKTGCLDIHFLKTSFSYGWIRRSVYPRFLPFGHQQVRIKLQVTTSTNGRKTMVCTRPPKLQQKIMLEFSLVHSKIYSNCNWTDCILINSF